MAILLYLKPVAEDWMDTIVIFFSMTEGEYLLSLINKAVNVFLCLSCEEPAVGHVTALWKFPV